MMETVAFSHATLASLSQKGTTNMEYLSSFSTSDVYGWICVGDHLEIFNKNNGSRISSAVFGAHGKSKRNTLITAVCQCPNSSRFIVATVTDDPHITGSLINLYNARTSKIEKVITAPCEITSIEYLENLYIPSTGRSNINERLRKFDGIVVLGTYGGHTCLLDLKLSQQSQTSEQNPGKIVEEASITRVLANNQHVAIWLGGDPKSQKAKNTSGLYVSSLKYVQKASLLAVGFSSGIMELWNLKSLSLVFNNFVAEIRKGLLISHFAFQEPENDPKNVCYLWVFYTPSQGSPSSLGQAFLLQMIFQERFVEAGIGYFYVEFMNAFLRFSHPLCSEPNSRLVAPMRILSCSCLSSAPVDEEGNCEGQDVMVVVWQETLERRDPRLRLLSFDLNQWYHRQMPSTLGSENSTSSDFILVHPLAQLEKRTNILHVEVKAKSVGVNEDSNCVLPVLDFELTFVTLSGLVFDNILNHTTQMSRDIERCKNSLFDKEAYHDVCYKMRDYHKEDLFQAHSTETNEHHVLLSVMLDSGSVGALISVVWQLARARQTGVESFLTLEQIVEWSRVKLLSIKKAFNKLVLPLLEFGPTRCEDQISTYKRSQNAVRWLLTVISELVNVNDAFSPEVQRHLFSYASLAMHIGKYVDASHWLLNARPMCVCHGPLKNEEFFERLTEYYKFRREDEVLTVDFMMQFGGEAVAKHFQSLSKTSTYPLLNMETFLGLYLLPNARMESKYFISLYFLEDLSSGASAETRSMLTTNFASEMNIRKSFVSLVRASWLLDHKEYKESFKILQRLTKESSLPSVFYACLVKIFLNAEKADYAMKLSKTFLEPDGSGEECRVLLEVLAAKGKINDAFKSLSGAPTGSAKYFSNAVSKFGKEGFLKEVLKVPMATSKSDETYYKTFSSIVDTSVNERLFNGSSIRAEKSLKCFASKAQNLPKGFKDIRQATSSIKKPKSSSRAQNDQDLEEKFTPDEIFMLPRKLEEYKEFLEIPLPIKESQPSTSVISHPSILFKHKSGESLQTTKHLRFAEPEVDIYDDDSAPIGSPINDDDDSCRKDSLPILVEEEEDGDYVNKEEPENEGQSYGEKEQVEERKVDSMETDEATEKMETKEDEVITESLVMAGLEDFTELGERTEPITEMHVNEDDEGKTGSQDVDWISVGTNDISELESCLSEMTENSLKRPPLKRSRKSQGHAPLTPPRRSSRLSTLIGSQQATEQQQQPTDRPTKQIKIEDSNLDASFLKSQERSADAREKTPTKDAGPTTPGKVAGIRHSARVAKRVRGNIEEEEEEEEEKVNSVKKTKLDESLLRTPTKGVPPKGVAANRTPRSARKFSRPNGDVGEEGVSSQMQRSSSWKEMIPTLDRTLGEGEGPLTPAQKSIRMRRVLREQVVKNVKDAQEPVEPADEGKTDESSKSRASSDERDVPENEGSRKFVFSPPLTRSRKKKTQH